MFLSVDELMILFGLLREKIQEAGNLEEESRTHAARNELEPLKSKLVMMLNLSLANHRFEVET
jgi:hypothetical protein